MAGAPPSTGAARRAAGVPQPPSPRPAAGARRPEAARAAAARLLAVAPWPSMAASGVDEDGSGGEAMAVSGGEGSMAISGGEPSMAASDVGVGRMRREENGGHVECVGFRHKGKRVLEGANTCILIY